MSEAPAPRIDYYDAADAPKPNGMVPSVNVIVVNDPGELVMMRRPDNGSWPVPVLQSTSASPSPRLRPIGLKESPREKADLDHCGSARSRADTALGQKRSHAGMGGLVPGRDPDLADWAVSAAHEILGPDPDSDLLVSQAEQLANLALDSRERKHDLDPEETVVDITYAMLPAIMLTSP